jgi:tetratricopeptide (TPR) repeat protein
MAAMVGDAGPDSPAHTNAFSGVAANVVQARDIYGDIHLHLGTEYVRGSRAQLLPEVPDFTDREPELAFLRQLVEESNQRTLCIAGPAGVGKTTLAIRLAHRLIDRFSFAQLYADLRGTEGDPEDPAEILGRFLLVLGARASRIPPGVGARGDLFRSLLWNRPAIVVLDNAASEAQVRRLLPGTPDCGVVVTSRRPLHGLEGAGFLQLNAFDGAASVELLTKVAGGDRVDQLHHVAELARLGGNLPLALRIIGVKLRAGPVSSAESLVGKLADERKRLKQLKVGDLDVRTGLSISYGQLEPPLDRYFRVLSVLPGVDFAVDTAAATLELSPEVTEEGLEALAERQLLEQTAPDRFRYHDLVRLFARELTERTETDSERRTAFVRGVQWYRDQADHWFREARYEDAPTADGLAWFDVEGGNALAALRAAVHEQAWRPAHELAEAVRDFFRYRGLTNEAEQVLRLGVAASAAGEEPEAEVTALIYLTMLLREAGRVAETPELYERALRVADDSDDSALRSWILTHFGDASLDFGDAERAIELYREALAGAAWLENTEKRAWMLTHLGLGLQNLGRHDEALTVYAEALELNRQRGDDLNAGWVLVHRAGILLDLHREADAEVDLQAAYEQGVGSRDLTRQAWVLGHFVALRLALDDVAGAREAALTVQALAEEMRNERLAETAYELLQDITEHEAP